MIIAERREEEEVGEYKMTEFKTKDSVTTFFFKGTHNSIVNAVRRIILDEVATIAIEEVEVVTNDSPLYDETIAHRLGLIPIKTDLKAYSFRESCKCGGIGCALCEVKMNLKHDEEGYVYSGKIKSDDPKIVPVDTEIPITKLMPGKVVELNMKAILGRGSEHAKWAPAHCYLKEGKKDEVELVVEPYGQLDSKQIFNEALGILIKKIEDLEEVL